MDRQPEFGLPGVALEPGDHICAMYTGAQERHEILAPFMRAGLAAGDKCICVIDPAEHAALREELGDGIDLEGCIASQQFALMGQADTYLRTGSFAVAEMIAFWQETVSEAMDDGQYAFTRSAGDTTWLRDTVGSFDDFASYESELNHFVPSYPQVILCLYDIELYGGEMEVEVLRTHPKLLIGGLLIDNPHYVAPADLVGRP
ncbi:MAG: eukaryotic-like serine/threonine-protein kinase [Actinomycetota bacterium]|jgi:hypothetical protein